MAVRIKTFERVAYVMEMSGEPEFIPNGSRGRTRRLLKHRFLDPNRRKVRAQRPMCQKAPCQGFRSAV